MGATLGFRADAYPCGARQPPHRHDELHLTLVLGGQLAETVAGVTEYAGAFAVVAKDAGVVHANLFGPEGARLARLSLAAGTIGALVEDPARSPAWRWTHDEAVARPFVRLVMRARGADSSFDGDDPDLLDLLAAVTARPAEPPRGSPPEWLARTMDSLRSAWTPSLMVTDLARQAGVHPVYLARAVRRWYGTGVGEELRRLRLRAAAHAIGGLRGTVSDVAHSCGFSDEAHLCRAFRDLLGITPGRYRALVRGLDYNPWAESGEDLVARIQVRGTGDAYAKGTTLPG